MINQTISHYRILEKLGEGGMGVVYKAEDLKLKRNVALKFLAPELTRDPQAKARFRHEAEAAAALSHPNICTIHEIDEHEGQFFIAMECHEGETLKERIVRGPLKFEEAIDIAQQVGQGLAKAHEQEIVHRDIKPANIFVTTDGLVKILDFGLAKLAGQTQLTKAGTTLGTAHYMSPEQANGKETDRRSDLWCLGVVLYEMVTGRAPFQGDHAQAIIYAILNQDQEPVTGLRTGVPLELERLIGRCLEKEPEARYQTAGDFASDLGRIQRMLVSAPANATPGSQIAARATQAPTRGPTIDVLPFTNASGDADQKYFSDGLTEDIVTELSRYHELTVIAYSSTEGYEDSDVDIREIGALPLKRYLLKGSIRKAGQQIRVSAQLSDSGDGRLVWGRNYERDLTARDLFELQDELAQQVVNAIAGSYGALTRAELPGARRKLPASLDSYDCVLRAYEYLHVHTPAKHLAARDCLERVVRGDPDYADGLAWLAFLYAEEYHHRWNERTDEYDALERALELAEEAIRLDTANHVAHGVLALTHFFSGEYERAKVEAYRTIDMNPNDTLWLALLGYYLAQQEDFEHGLPMVRKAIALDPHPPGWVTVPFFYDHYQHGRYEQALSELRRIYKGHDFRGPLYVAAAYGQLGRPEDAGQALDDMRALWLRPVGEMRRELIERHALSVALTDHLLEGLAKAGLEGAAD